MYLKITVELLQNVMKYTLCISCVAYLQIEKIRGELRKKKLAGVIVENVHNCQGVNADLLPYVLCH